jgi:hypothetical protein
MNTEEDLVRGCRNSVRQVAVASKFCKMAPETIVLGSEVGKPFISPFGSLEF